MKARFFLAACLLVLCQTGVSDQGIRNLRKLFPEKKEEIDAFFKSGKSVSSNLDEAMATLSQWLD